MNHSPTNTNRVQRLDFKKNHSLPPLLYPNQRCKETVLCYMLGHQCPFCSVRVVNRKVSSIWVVPTPHHRQTVYFQNLSIAPSRVQKTTMNSWSTLSSVTMWKSTGRMMCSFSSRVSINSLARSFRARPSYSCRASSVSHSPCCLVRLYRRRQDQHTALQNPGFQVLQGTPS